MMELWSTFMRVLNWILGITALGLLPLAQPAAAASPPMTTVFNSGLTGSSLIQGIAAGPDGNFWFTAAGIPGLGISGAIGRITRAGVITQFTSGLNTGSNPAIIVAGPDGNLWFVDQGTTPAIGRITPTGVITEFNQGLNPNSFLPGITTGPDGNLWFTVGAPAPTAIGRITPTGVITQFAQGRLRQPGSIAAGADGTLWFSDGTFFGHVVPSTGVVTDIEPPTGMAFMRLAAGPDGNIWFTGVTLPAQQGLLGSIDSTGAITTFSQGLNAGSFPNALAAGPDGNLWFTDGGPTKSIGRMTTAGTITEFPQDPGLNTPVGIAAGPTNALWLADTNAHAIGRLTLPTDVVTAGVSGSGEVTSLPAGIACGNGNQSCSAGFADSTPVTLIAAPAAGFDFAGWSGGACSGTGPCTVSLSADTNVGANFVAHGTSGVALVSAVLPSSRSVQAGTTATAFGTVINTSADTTATGCTVQAETDVTTGFYFQVTDPATNRPVGPVNPSITLPPGGAQSVILSLTPSASFAPTAVAFNFSCANAPSAVSNFGLNTLLLSASSAPAADVVALAATTTNDGIVDIPGANGIGAFAVATINLGAPAVINASANTGTADLPVTITICETVPATGQCLAPTTASVNTSIATNATPTFAIFVQGSASVPFQPAMNRVFVQFKDAGNAVRGSTSVAVRTQ